MGVRGRVVTAYDAGVALGGPRAAAAPDHRILLVDVAGSTLGLVVEEVCAVAALPADPLAGEEAPGRPEWDGTPVETLDLEHLLERVLVPSS